MARNAGCSRVKSRHWLLALLLSQPLHAADTVTPTARDGGSAARGRMPELPSPELLEFLGEWTDEKGAAIDPFTLPKLDQKNAAPKKDSGDTDEKDAR